MIDIQERHQPALDVESCVRVWLVQAAVGPGAHPGQVNVIASEAS